jgi:signal transduction histidine kinase
MPQAQFPRLTLVTTLAGVALLTIFVALLLRFRVELRDEIRQKIIGRDAAVLHTVALQQLAESETNPRDGTTRPNALLTAVLRSAQQQRGMFAVAIFDADGNTIEAMPSGQLFVDLPADDYLQLLEGQPISRYYQSFALDRAFAGITTSEKNSPVLEVLLPLHGRDAARSIGFVRYTIDARPLAQELAAIDARLNRQATTTLALGTLLIAGVMIGAALALHRAQRTIAERNDRLARTHFELTLAAKASALGQIASHLIHGLQGPVAGLRAVVANHGTSGAGAEDWRSASDYAERLQVLIAETVGLLGDARTGTAYELTGGELIAIIGARHAATAQERQIHLQLSPAFSETLDSHRGSVLCLIAANLVQNAIAASASGETVKVDLTRTPQAITLTVADSGAGIPPAVRARLFEPGQSGRPGGTGLGLAISRLLALQIGADLALVHTSAEGTRFALTLPLT